MEEITYTVRIISNNTPGVLYRIAGVFLRRKINIEQLHVWETPHKGISEFRVDARITEKKIQNVIAQLNKIIDVHTAELITYE